MDAAAPIDDELAAFSVSMFFNNLDWF